MVDTRDLKSLGQKCPCGFDSRLRHEWTVKPVHSCFLGPLKDPVPEPVSDIP